MAFRLPTFNVECAFWRNGNPVTNPPDVVSQGNLSPGRVTGTDVPAGATTVIGLGGMWLRLPPRTDVRDAKAPGGADTCEVPHGSGRHYDVRWVDDIALAFPNEHRFAVIQAPGPWPVPFPGGAGLPPAPPPSTPTGLGSGSTAGTPANSLTVPVVLPAAGKLSVVLVTFGDFVFATVNGNGEIDMQDAEVDMGLGNVEIYRFGFAAGAGPLNVVANLAGGAARQMLMRVVFMPQWGLTIPNHARSSDSGGGLPTMSLAGPSGAPTTLLSDFVIIGGSGSFAWNPPWTALGPIPVEIFGGQSCVLPGAYVVTGTPQNPTASVDMVSPPVGYCGIEADCPP